MKNHVPREHLEAKAAAILNGNFYFQPNRQASSILWPTSCVQLNLHRVIDIDQNHQIIEITQFDAGKIEESAYF